MFDLNLIEQQHFYGAAENIIYIWQLLQGNSKLIATLDNHTSLITGMQQVPESNNLIRYVSLYFLRMTSINFLIL